MPSRDSPSQFPKRYMLSLLGFFGMLITSVLRANLSIAIIAMITPQNITISSNKTIIIPAEFNWTTTTQGFLLSSFFYGYVVSQIPAGFLATKFGGQLLFGVSIGGCAFLTLFSPLCARSGSGVLIFLRILEGLCSGFVYPSLHALWSKWAPKTDKSKLSAFAFSGAYVGTFLTMLFGGVIATDWSWQWIFYLSGLLGVIWAIVWFFVTAESPANHSSISLEEVKYIEENMDQSMLRNDTIPWRDILTSLPVWAIVATHFGANWSIFAMFTELPTFLVKTLGYEVDTAGVLAALPWLPLAFTVYGAGLLSDKLTEKYSTSYVRKLIMTLAFIIGIFSLLFVTLINSKHNALIVIGIIILISACGPAWASFGANQLDISGHYAGVIMGLSNCVGSIPGFLAPMITGYIVENPHLKREWNITFIITMVISTVSMIIYIIFASGELQPWAANIGDEYEPVEDDSQVGGSKENNDEPTPKSVEIGMEDKVLPSENQ